MLRETLIVVGLFIGTMVAMVFLAERGFNLIPAKKLERYAHALAGLAITSSGLAIQFLGL